MNNTTKQITSADTYGMSIGTVVDIKEIDSRWWIKLWNIITLRPNKISYRWVKYSITNRVSRTKFTIKKVK